MMFKKCSKCLKKFELNCFYKNSFTKTGLASYCKQCSHSAVRNMPDGYQAYIGAKTRCKNIKCPQFKNYGGRGIEFRFNSFKEFMAHIGPRPPGMSLDRIDNNGHYEPGNVRWASNKTQCRNRRSNKLTYQQVAEMRDLHEKSELSIYKLAKIFNINRGYAWRVINLENWM